jgi:hypothetical protein
MSSLLCIRSHDMNILLPNYKFYLILGTVGQRGMQAPHLRFVSQIFILREYLAVTAPPDIQSYRCAVHVTAGYISYQYNVTTQKGKP